VGENLFNHNFAWSHTVQTSGPAETQNLGERIAQALLPGDLITLRGGLGAGKTTLTQGIACGLETEESVTSPTFVLMLEYSGRVPLLHLDAYRLENPSEDELGDAGIWDLLERTDAVKLIEWPERLEGWLPRPRLDLHLEALDENTRRITLSSNEALKI
jgi:tRNA threonylcarbamoyladenosine biosynthesis protein TsaE